MLGLFGQQCHTGNARNLQRTMSLMQVQACALDGVLAMRVGPQLVQRMRDVLQRLPDLWHEPGQSHHIDIVAVFHPSPSSTDWIAQPDHPEMRSHP